MPDTPGVLNFPTTLDNALTLIEANNLASSGLTDDLADTDLVIPVDESLFSDSGIVTIVDSLSNPTKRERAYFTSKTSGFLIVPMGGRGVLGTTAQDFSAGAIALQLIEDRHHEILVEAILALQAKLGIGASMPQTGKVPLSTSNGVSIWSFLGIADIVDLQEALDDLTALAVPTYVENTTVSYTRAAGVGYVAANAASAAQAIDLGDPDVAVEVRKSDSTDNEVTIIYGLNSHVMSAPGQWVKFVKDGSDWVLWSQS